jgi:type II secretory pathway pseudopilin PulG
MELDFARRQLRGGVAGIAVAIVGVVGLLAAVGQQRALDAQRAGLELRRDALERSQHQGASLQSIAGLGAQQAEKTVSVLATPWSQLLAQLETASADSSGNIALLSIEPDHAKHRVRVTAEARSLHLALSYVQRLRKSDALRYPMLEAHELKKDDPQHPVRFQLTADWDDAS